MGKIRYIFVHGLSGWGSYDRQYRRTPYWGMRGGDLMAFLRNLGYDCYAASVSPKGSAWDRACELYAQLFGARVDYGQAHSSEKGHARFGRDFSDCPLVDGWEDGSRMVLIGHSFGGATIRLFSTILALGNERERSISGDDVSPFFKGGRAHMVHSVVTLASPMNGTTAYDLFDDPSFDPDAVKVPWWSRVMGKVMAMNNRLKPDGRDISDYAAFDMHIDNALKLNSEMPELEGTYYFSVPCSFTRVCEDGKHRPKKGMEPLFFQHSTRIGTYTGKTRGGFEIGSSWLENDGLVNTVSAMAPLGSPSCPLDRGNPKKGVWNVFPTFDGDHMWVQGGLFRRHMVRDFYLDLLSVIPS